MINHARAHIFNNLGYLLTKVPENILQELKNKTEKIKEDFTKAIPYNHTLAGNLQYEFLIENSPEFDSFILEAIALYESQFHHAESINIMTDNVSLYVGKPWVNLMKKHEFNPPHNHTGVFSYVIWLDIPYDIEEEKKSPSSVNSNANYPGHFGFIYNNILGDIQTKSLPVDKNWNGTLCLFPAKLFHYVNPFSTSEEYRITVAGNILLDTRNIKKKEEND